MTSILKNQYLSTAELADLLRVRKNTVDRWRVERTCPVPWTKICGRVLFNREDVMTYLESQKRDKVNPIIKEADDAVAI